MNDVISTTLPGAAAPVSGTGGSNGLFSGGQGLAGLDGVFAKLMALAMPEQGSQPALLASSGGHALPGDGTGLPQGSITTGEELTKFLKQFAGNVLDSGELESLREQGITKEALLDISDKLERSDIAQMPAIAEIIERFRVLAEDEAAVLAQGPEAPIESPAEVSGVVSTVPAVSEEEFSEVAEKGIPGIGNAEHRGSLEGGTAKNLPEAQRVDRPVAGEAVLDVDQARSRPVAGELGSVSSGNPSLVEQKPLDHVSEQVSGSRQELLTAKQVAPAQQENSLAPKVDSGIVQPYVAKNQVLPIRSDVSVSPVTSVSNESPNELFTQKANAPVLAERVSNVAVADIVKSQQSQVAAATRPIESDAELLMSRLVAAAAASGEVAASQSHSILGNGVAEREGYDPIGGAQISVQKGEGGGFAAIPVNAVPSPAAFVAAAPSAPPSVASQPAVQVVNNGVAFSEQVDVSSQPPVAANTNENSRVVREPTQLVNVEQRVQFDAAGARVGSQSGAAASVSAVEGQLSSGGERGRDESGARDDGRSGDGRNQTAVAQSSTRPAGESAASQFAQQLGLAGKPQLNSPAWPSAMGNQVVWLASQNNKVAEIQLDPPELGSLQVKVRVNQDQVSVSFVSPHASVRDAVEQSVARLREMFEEQGLTLADASVEDQSPQQGHGQDGDGQQGRGLASGADSAEGSGEPLEERSLNLVDYYA